MIPEVERAGAPKNPAEAARSDQGNYWLRPLVCTAIGLVLNALLAVFKTLVGMLAGSTALVADGLHSFADVASDIGLIFALKAASRPPDAEHPYGHHSFETLGAIVVALLMLLTAGLIGKGAVLRLIGQEFLHPTWPALLATLFSVLLKEALARYTLLAGRIHNSPALQANGTMHRSDAISSLAAAAGIGGAMLGWFFLDSVGALVISIFILKMGWDLLRENVSVLMDTMPQADLIDAIKESAGTVPCVQEIRELTVRQRGSYFLADIRIAIHPDHTIEVSHDIAHATEEAIKENVPTVTRVFVHVEPGLRMRSDSCNHIDQNGI